MCELVCYYEVICVFFGVVFFELRYLCFDFVVDFVFFEVVMIFLSIDWGWDDLFFVGEFSCEGFNVEYWIGFVFVCCEWDYWYGFFLCGELYDLFLGCVVFDYEKFIEMFVCVDDFFDDCGVVLFVGLNFDYLVVFVWV